MGILKGRKIVKPKIPSAIRIPKVPPDPGVVEGETYTEFRKRLSWFKHWLRRKKAGLATSKHPSDPRVIKRYEELEALQRKGYPVD
ncbi:MAG: hypothetical protein GTO29_08195 [Candidatus Latescibacteria bacterium]|nr:hypothetical protein [Candidatus Latescibacterota bacterium]NIO56142.1 hypothetical protein [Candidatus Latescibacterota bacterium]